MADGNLRKLFQQHIPEAHWQSVETFSTGRGVPDMNYCLDGVEGWIEGKRCLANAVGIRPEQLAWIEMRIRAGGRVFVAIRRINAGRDELFLFTGQHARSLMDHGLPKLARPWSGGPARWDWDTVRKILRGWNPPFNAQVTGEQGE